MGGTEWSDEAGKVDSRHAQADHDKYLSLSQNNEWEVWCVCVPSEAPGLPLWDKFLLKRQIDSYVD